MWAHGLCVCYWGQGPISGSFKNGNGLLDSMKYRTGWEIIGSSAPWSKIDDLTQRHLLWMQCHAIYPWPLTLFYELFFCDIYLPFWCQCLQDGSWLLVDNVNLCSSAVLDRLNALLEPGGSLTIGERGVGPNGEVVTICPHPGFRLFLTMDPHNGEISR